MTDEDIIASWSDAFLQRRREHFVKYLDPDVLWQTTPDLDMHPFGELRVQAWLDLVNAEMDKRGLAR